MWISRRGRNMASLTGQLGGFLKARTRKFEREAQVNVSFDDVAGLVGLLVMADFLLAVGFARDDSFDAAIFEEGPDSVGIVGFVGEQFLDARDQAHAVFGHHAIGGVSGREDEGPGPTEFIDDRVDLAVAAAFRNTDRLKIGPPFPP